MAELHFPDTPGKFSLVLEGSKTTERKDFSDPVQIFDCPITNLIDIATVLEEYDILENDDNELFFALPSVLGSIAGRAYLFYGGGEHALLWKGSHCLAVCDYLHSGIHESLSRCKQVLFGEGVRDAKVYVEYMAEKIEFQKTDEIANAIITALEV